MIVPKMSPKAGFRAQTSIFNRENAPRGSARPLHGQFICHPNPCFCLPGVVLAKNDSADPTRIVGSVNEIRVQDGWIQISPYGEFPNDRGLQVVDRIAAEMMVRDFNSLAARLSNDWRGLPFYIGHPDDPETGNEYPDKKSYGWWKGLEARNDGFYGKAKMSRAGQEMLDEGHFMYVSAFWGMTPIPGRNDAYRPVVLYSVGMTNTPNIPVRPTGRNEKKPNQNDTMKKEDKEKLIKALGLKADATDEEILAAANEAQRKINDALREKTEAENKVSLAANEKTTLEGKVTAANSATATAEERYNGERKARIDMLLTAAVNEGRITEADRPKWAGDLTQDFDKKSAELAGLKKTVNTDARTKSMGARRGEVTVPTNKITAINEAVNKRMKETGSDYNAAFSACRADSSLTHLFEEEAVES